MRYSAARSCRISPGVLRATVLAIGASGRLMRGLSPGRAVGMKRPGAPEPALAAPRAVPGRRPPWPPPCAARSFDRSTQNAVALSISQQVPTWHRSCMFLVDSGPITLAGGANAGTARERQSTGCARKSTASKCWAAVGGGGQQQRGAASWRGMGMGCWAWQAPQRCTAGCARHHRQKWPGQPPPPALPTATLALPRHIPASPARRAAACCCSRGRAVRHRGWSPWRSCPTVSLLPLLAMGG